MVALSGRILESAATLARSDGAVPLGVYFPTNSEADFPESSNLLGHRVLQLFPGPVIDLTPCLREVGSHASRTATGKHLNGRANFAAASLVASHVQQAMRSKRPNRETRQ
jgi:hypothetical protein